MASSLFQWDEDCDEDDKVKFAMCNVLPRGPLLLWILCRNGNLTQISKGLNRVLALVFCTYKWDDIEAFNNSVSTRNGLDVSMNWFTDMKED
ncbi:hypothetical protein Tco_1560858 [Tanacetum coccineum]